MNIPVLLTLLLVAFIILAFVFFAETVKAPEKFIVYLADDTGEDIQEITGIEMYDSSGKMLYNVMYSDKGSPKTFRVYGCAAFVLSWSGPKKEKIVGLGPFVTGPDVGSKVVPRVFGRRSEDFEIYTNSDQIPPRHSG